MTAPGDRRRDALAVVVSLGRERDQNGETDRHCRDDRAPPECPTRPGGRRRSFGEGGLHRRRNRGRPAGLSQAWLDGQRHGLWPRRLSRARFLGAIPPPPRSRSRRWVTSSRPRKSVATPVGDQVYAGPGDPKPPSNVSDSRSFMVRRCPSMATGPSSHSNRSIRVILWVAEAQHVGDQPWGQRKKM
jgi:hypothetical protein